MNERTGIITFKGNPFTLLGAELKVGAKAPEFSVVDNSLAPAALASYSGKIKVISAVPSLDTPVCDTETRRFNQEAAGFPDNVVVLTISLDRNRPGYDSFRLSGALVCHCLRCSHQRAETPVTVDFRHRCR